MISVLYFKSCGSVLWETNWHFSHYSLKIFDQLVGFFSIDWLKCFTNQWLITCFVSMNQNDFIQYNSNWKVMKIYWSKVWEPFVKLIQYYTNHMDPALFVCLYFGAWMATVLIHFLLSGQDIHHKFCSRKSGRFGTTWGWVNDKIFILGWTIPLRIATYRVKWLMLYCFTNKVGIWIIQLYNFTKF